MDLACAHYLCALLVQLVRFISETLNGHLPLKHNSDRRQTWPTRVSDDPRHFIFRSRKCQIVVNFERSFTPRR